MIIHDSDKRARGRQTDTIEELYLWVSEKENGVEGMLAFNGLPLVVSSRDLAQNELKRIALKIQQEVNQPMKLIRLTGREVIDELKGV